MATITITHPHLQNKKFGHSTEGIIFKNEMAWREKFCYGCQQFKVLSEFAWFDDVHYRKPKLIGEWSCCEECRTKATQKVKRQRRK